ncbi:hypothetical protein [Streptomyces sp. H51]|uniref:hypothetical protein n=1 Tax=Streptomyces sp. H51 TaxID=3111770 RepID=UPI002D79D3BF|nr:hypothetical protein [Streptomyces sp. H51]
MPHLFLNEKSCETEADPDRVNQAMTKMVEAVLAIAKEDRQGTALVTHATSLMALQLAQGHPIGKWMATPGIEELRVLLKRLEDRSPYDAVFPDGETYSDIAFHHDGEPVRGLGYAYLLGGIGVSLPLEPRWNADRITLVQEQLMDDEESGSVLTEVEVRHAAGTDHVAPHLRWIREEAKAAVRDGLEAIRTGAELWERCAGLFPHLRFLPHVEAQVRELKQSWVRPVRKRLAEMDHAVRVWDSVTQPDGPQWGSVVTPERQGRKRDHCLFTDLDGTPQYFDTHLRFTPDEGRVHFLFVKETRLVHIAHIGRKLGI